MLGAQVVVGKGGGGHHGGHHGGGWGGWGPSWPLVLDEWELDEQPSGIDDVLAEKGLEKLIDDAVKERIAAQAAPQTKVSGLMCLGADDTLDARAKLARARIQAIQPVTLAVALKITEDGLKAANKALEIVKSDAYKKSTAGVTALTEEGVGRYYWQLKWHQDNLVKLVAGKDAKALNGTAYADADDLKRAAGSAVTELLVADFGATFFDRVNDEFWGDVETGLKQYAKQVAEGVTNPIKTITGLPLWAWLVIALGGVLLLTVGGYFIATRTALGKVALHRVIGG